MSDLSVCHSLLVEVGRAVAVNNWVGCQDVGGVTGSRGRGAGPASVLVCMKGDEV